MEVPRLISSFNILTCTLWCEKNSFTKIIKGRQNYYEY